MNLNKVDKQKAELYRKQIVEYLKYYEDDVKPIKINIDEIIKKIHEKYYGKRGREE